MLSSTPTRWLLIGVLAVCSEAVPAAETLRYFRSDGGVATEKAPLPDNFAQDARLIWRRELAPGHSTPCVHGTAIYVTTFDQEQTELATVALDRQTGATRWSQVAPADRLEAFHPTGSPASSSPACDGERVYSFFGSYGLLCYDREGKLLWSKPLGPFQDEFGAASSPVLAGELVILNEDHDVNSFLIAVHRATGETAWQTSREGFVRSYSTPIIWQQEGRPQVVVAGSLQLAAYDVADGRKVWWVEGLSRIVDSTPSIAAGQIYLATWTPGGDDTSRIALEPYADALQKYDANANGLVEKSELPEGEVQARFFRMDLNQDERLDADEWAKYARIFEQAKNVAMAVQPGGAGDITSRAVRWVFRRSLPTVPSSLVYDGVLYMVKDGGIVTSLDTATGAMLKQGRVEGSGNYYASLVAGDGKIYLCSEAGVVTVLQAGRNWTTLSSHDFGERIMATPVIDQGQILIRTEAALYCYAKGQAAAP